MKSNTKEFYQIISLPIYFVVTVYVLIFCLENRNYFIEVDMMKFIVIGLLIFTIFVNTERSKLKLQWWIYLLLFGTIALLSTHGSADYLISSIKISLDFFIISFGFLLYIIFFNDLQKYAKPTLLLIVLVFVVYSAPITLPEIISQIPSDDRATWLAGFKLTQSFKLSYYDHLRVYSFHAFISCCCGYILVKHAGPEKWLRTFYLILFCICFFALLISYGRGSILAFIAFLVFDAYFTKGLIASLKAGAIAIVAFLISYAIIYFTPLSIISEFLFSSFVRGEDHQLDGTANALSSGRLDMWAYALKVTLNDSPFYGHGPSSAVWLFKGTDHSYASQPHNAVIQFIMDYGFLGASIICFLMYKMIKNFYIRFSLSSSNELLRRSLASFVAAYIVYALTDGLFYHPYPMIHFAIIVAVLAAMHGSVCEQQ